MQKKAIYIIRKGKGGWEKEKDFKLRDGYDGEFRDKICAKDSSLYISSHIKHSIYWYTSDGAPNKLISEPVRLKHPRYLEVDSTGKLVVCDYGNKRLQVYDPESRAWQILMQDLPSAPIALALSSNRMWVVISQYKLGIPWKHKLCKYEAQ